MKKFWKSLLCFSTVTVLCCSAVGCKKDTNVSNNVLEEYVEPTSVTKYDTIGETEILLCDNGKTDYKIVVPEKHTAIVDYGVNDLIRYFELSTGAKLSSETDGNNYSEQDKIISIGKTSAFNKSGVQLDPNLGRDGYQIDLKGNNILICGEEDFGSVYGIFEFLKYEIDFEPYSQNEVYYTKHSTLKVKRFNVKDIPAFGARTADGIFQHELETGYRLRILTDYYFMPATMNNGSTSEWIPAPDHTFKKILSYAKYGQDHPDWFIEGDVLSGQICLTNEELIETFIGEVKNLVSENQEGKVVSITQQDGASWCQCERCQFEREKYSFSGYLIRFVNKIIEGFLKSDGSKIEGVEEWVNKTFPERDLIYSTFAYGDTVKPPVTESGELIDESCKPNEKLYIRYAYNACWYHEITDSNCPLNVASNSYINSWKKICNNFLVWHYAADYNNYLIFFNDFSTVKKNLEIYKEMGAKHLFWEFASGTNVYPFANLRTYLFAKLSWDLSLDTGDLINDFIEHYYKEASGYVKEYLNFTLDHWAAMDEQTGHGFHATTPTNSSIDYWPRNIVDKSLEILDNALKCFDGVQEKEYKDEMRRRVLYEKFCVLMLKLKNYSAYGYNADEYDDFVAEVKAVMQFTGAKNYAEFKSLEDYMSNV